MDVSNLQDENSPLAKDTVTYYHLELVELDKQKSKLCQRRAILHAKLKSISNITASSIQQASSHLEAARYAANIPPISTATSSSTLKKHKLLTGTTQSNPNKRKKVNPYDNPHHPSYIPYDTLLATNKVKSIHDIPLRMQLHGELVLVKGIIKSIVDLNPNNPNKKALLLSPITIAYNEYSLPYQKKISCTLKVKVKNLVKLVGKEMSFLARAKVANDESIPEEDKQIDFMHREVFHMYVEGKPRGLHSRKSRQIEGGDVGGTIMEDNNKEGQEEEVDTKDDEDYQKGESDNNGDSD